MIQSFKVATTLAAQRIVAITAADTVGYPANNQALPIGITKDTVLGVNQAIPVAGPGEIAKLYFASSVAAAGLVQSNSSGQGVAFTVADTTTALTLTSAYVGVLVGAAVNSAAAIGTVFVMPGFDRE